MGFHYFLCITIYITILLYNPEKSIICFISWHALAYCLTKRCIRQLNTLSKHRRTQIAMSIITDNGFFRVTDYCNYSSAYDYKKGIYVINLTHIPFLIQFIFVLLCIIVYINYGAPDIQPCCTVFPGITECLLLQITLLQIQSGNLYHKNTLQVLLPLPQQ